MGGDKGKWVDRKGKGGGGWKKSYRRLCDSVIVVQPILLQPILGQILA